MPYPFPHHPHPDFQVNNQSATGVFPFLRPTYAQLTSLKSNTPEWKSRNQRKARYHHDGQSHASRLGRITVIEYWNISWWIAMLFTIGSIVWVINGFYVFLPFCDSQVPTNTVAGGWSAWVGATIFAVAASLPIWEAWNRGETAYFGWGLDQALHRRYKSHKENGITTVDSRDPEPAHQWIWFTTDTKYWHEIGFIAAVIQCFGATVFWISGFTGLPAIQDVIKDNPPLLAGIYWSPQVIGGSGFIISSVLYMLETQKKWYIPAVTELGWHVGFWNFLGGIGFTICGAFGYSTAHWAMYQSTLSTFWGGWAFLIGSLIQLYEAVNPVGQLEAGREKHEKV